MSLKRWSVKSIVLQSCIKTNNSFNSAVNKRLFKSGLKWLQTLQLKYTAEVSTRQNLQQSTKQNIHVQFLLLFQILTGNNDE